MNPHSHYKILVVEDDEILRLAVGDILLAAGYQVRDAGCGTDAVALLKENPSYDLILSDLKMPEMDGIELQHYVKKHCPHILFVLVTSHADVQTAVQAMRDGAFNYVLKPVSKEQLLNAVQEALEYISKTGSQLPQTPIAQDAQDRFIEIGNLMIDRYQLEVVFNGIALELTPTEYEILHHLVIAHGRVMTFEEIVFATQGMKVERAEARVMLSTHLSNLRSKLAKTGGGDYLVNRRGTGYLIAVNE